MATVLLIDDDDAIRESLGWILHDAGYTVVQAATAQQGIAALGAASDPIVVLFDYIMPNETGEDFVRTAQSEVPFAERHAYICFTASPTRVPASLSEWLAQRGAPTIAKPFDLEALFAVVEREAARLPAHS